MINQVAYFITCEIVCLICLCGDVHFNKSIFSHNTGILMMKTGDIWDLPICKIGSQLPWIRKPIILI